VKVLDIDRDRQRISLGLKQTQTDPWQQVLDSYGEGDVVQGKVTKVVTFGAFVEILPGVEGLVHISELAQHHVENPREVVSQGDVVNAKIIEVDAERRRLSLSLKRVEEGEGQPLPEGARPQIDLSEDVFSDQPATASEFEPEADAEVAVAAQPASDDVVAETSPDAEPATAEAAAEQPSAEETPSAEASVDAEPATAEAAAEQPSAEEAADGPSEGAA
jgi:small subunit ribosomal protein S1